MDVDTAQRREVTEGLWRSSGGYELVFSPLLLALVGLWIDHSIGTTPLLTVAAAVLGFLGAVVKLWYGYKHDMDALDEAGPWAKRS
jgi:F0F1-type ATP synthase assembly protein I